MTAESSIIWQPTPFKNYQMRERPTSLFGNKVCNFELEFCGDRSSFASQNGKEKGTSFSLYFLFYLCSYFRYILSKKHCLVIVNFSVFIHASLVQWGPQWFQEISLKHIPCDMTNNSSVMAISFWWHEKLPPSEHCHHHSFPSHPSQHLQPQGHSLLGRFL